MSDQHWSQTEPPVEAAIRFVYDGFDTTLTIRANDGKEIMPQIIDAIAYLKAKGATPAAQAAQPPAPVHTAPPTKVCPIHNVVMKRREKNGDVWYSHQAIDPDTGQSYYCKGKGKE